MAAHEIRIDQSRTLAEEPGTGHNRWHPGIPPILAIDPGDEVLMEARDGGDALISRDSTPDDLLRLDLNKVHPLTGPVYVRDAEPGDLLAVDILEVIPGAYGFTLALPGFGYLRDVFDEPFCAKWEQHAGGAVCEEIPGVRIPGAPFMGVMGVAPSHAMLARIAARENDLVAGGGMALPPSAEGAITRNPAIDGEALRTMPPREHGGNFDTKQMTAGTTVYSRSGPRARSSRRATATSPRAAASAAARPSRPAPRCARASACARASLQSAASATSTIRAATPRRSAMRSTAAATTPPPGSASRATGPTAPRTSISRPGTRCSTSSTTWCTSAGSRASRHT